MLAIVDDFSCVVWIYLLQHKSQVVTTFSSFIKMVETQFSVKIKIVRTDNGSEFININFLNLLSQHSIIHQRSCVYTPQQNDIVQRKHRHLLQLARSLMSQDSLPEYLFALLPSHGHLHYQQVTYPILNWKTPYELLFYKQPNYSNLKLFGCLSFATNVKPHKHKFETRAHKCIFLGFSPSQKAYKLYNLDTKQTIVSRDVSFYEYIFPFPLKSNIAVFLLLYLSQAILLVKILIVLRIMKTYKD